MVVHADCPAPMGMGELRHGVKILEGRNVPMRTCSNQFPRCSSQMHDREMMWPLKLTAAFTPRSLPAMYSFTAQYSIQQRRLSAKSANGQSYFPVATTTAPAPARLQQSTGSSLPRHHTTNVTPGKSCWTSVKSTPRRKFRFVYRFRIVTSSCER